MWGNKRREEEDWVGPALAYAFLMSLLVSSSSFSRDTTHSLQSWQHFASAWDVIVPSQLLLMKMHWGTEENLLNYSVNLFVFSSCFRSPSVDLVLITLYQEITKLSWPHVGLTHSKPCIWDSHCEELLFSPQKWFVFSIPGIDQLKLEAFRAVSLEHWKLASDYLGSRM